MLGPPETTSCRTLCLRTHEPDIGVYLFGCIEIKTHSQHTGKRSIDVCTHGSRVQSSQIIAMASLPPAASAFCAHLHTCTCRCAIVQRRYVCVCVMEFKPNSWVVLQRAVRTVRKDWETLTNTFDCTIARVNPFSFEL